MLKPLFEVPSKLVTMLCCFSQSNISVSLDILKHLETCRPLLVLKQSCTAAEGLQPVSKKDLLATARHKLRVKTSQSYARVNIYLAVSLENPINCWPPVVTKRWVEAACVAAPMPVPAMKVWNCKRLYYINIDAWKRLIKSTKWTVALGVIYAAILPTKIFPFAFKLQDNNKLYPFSEAVR